MVHDRRWTYFVFQGLLTVIILLFFFYHRDGVASWQGKFTLLSVAFLASLLGLRRVDTGRLGGLSVQGGIFVFDSVLASLSLYWTQQPRSEIYLTYFLIIFGTALTRSLKQSFLIASVASAAYVATAWDPGLGAVQESSFWLRLVYLWVMASFAAVLSLDARRQTQTQELAHQASLRSMEQLAALGRLSGEVAHGIKGPLTTILVNTDMLLQKHGRLPGVEAELTQIQGEVARCREVLQNLLELGRIEEMDYDLFDLRDPVRSALAKTATRLKHRRLKVVKRGFDRPAPVLGDPSLLFEAVYEVLANAEQAARPGGRIEVALRTVQKRPWWDAEGGAARAHVELTVSDDGSGMDPATLVRAFDPFFTTKKKDGSGLGLSSALRILHKHSGTLEAASDGLGRGSRFTFSLPRFRRVDG
jgi:signal transduction histidine kinase